MDSCRCAGRLAPGLLLLVAFVALVATTTGALLSKESKAGLTVLTNPAFFNPSLGQTAEIHIEGAPLAPLTLEILDRDGFVIRTLRLDEDGSPLRWDGRDEAGEVVPDEAYTVRIVRKDPSGSRTVLYDPSADFAPEPLDVQDIAYSRHQGILSYTLPAPARVHIQAGQSRPHPETGEPQGPVLRTVVDRRARAGGAVVESWSGRDESGVFYVPDLPNFAVSIFATTLPENSLITVGNRAEGFLEYARRLRPQGILKPRSLADHPRGHATLTALEDHSPALTVRPDALFEEQQEAWLVQKTLRLQVEVDRVAAPYFLAQPTELFLFVDGEEVLRVKNPDNPVHVTVAGGHLSSGEHKVAVNWASELGPVGIQTLRIRVDHDGEGIAEGRR